MNCEQKRDRTLPGSHFEWCAPRGTIVGMPNIASLLKTEISRVARKEVRADTMGLKKTLGVYRVEIAALKRRAQALESELRRLSKAHAKAAPVEVQAQPAQKLRFTAKGLGSSKTKAGAVGSGLRFAGGRVWAVDLQLGGRQGPPTGQAPAGRCGAEDLGQERSRFTPGVVAVVAQGVRRPPFPGSRQACRTA
jgi:hypothetical protein